MIAIQCATHAPPHYHYTELVLHSLISQDFVIQAGSKLGEWKILSLNTKVKFVPLQLPQQLISKLVKKSELLKTFNLRQDLSNSLSKLLILKENGV